MDLFDQLRTIAARITKQLPELQTEEAAKASLVMPFIRALGYDVFDPSEVKPEFTADVGVKKGEKVDYAIMRDGKPAILVECKGANSDLRVECASQLYRYFSVTSAKFAVLTNGVTYRFFTDLEAPNRMDSRPFLDFSMLELNESLVAEIKKFSKESFDLDTILSTASQLKYMQGIKTVLGDELNSPSEDFVRMVTERIYAGRFTQAVKDRFTVATRQAFQDFVEDRVNERLKAALQRGANDSVAKPAPSLPDPSAADGDGAEGIVTTDEEREGFYIVKAILCETIKIDRVVMRDTQSYCGILLDDNNRKPICRLRFNFSQKYLGLFDDNKQETKQPLDSVSDIYRHADQLRRTAASYDKSDAATVA